jgi:hypothetical protein
MAIVEVQGSGKSWAEPDDLDVSRPQSLPEGNYAGGNLVLFADGSVRFMEQTSLTPAKVRALATRSGGERIEIDAEEFAHLLKALRAESFDSGKLSFLDAMDPSHHFTSQQIRELLSEFAFDHEREEAALALHPRVTDPTSFYVTLGAFDTDTSLKSVVQQLALDRPAKSFRDEPGDAVSPQEQQTLIAGLKATPLDAGKLALLKVILHGRVFTSDQAAELLEPFGHDMDRETAAVAIYPRVSDPKNFYRALAAFTFDSGRESVRKQLKLERVPPGGL